MSTMKRKVTAPSIYNEYHLFKHRLASTYNCESAVHTCLSKTLSSHSSIRVARAVAGKVSLVNLFSNEHSKFGNSTHCRLNNNLFVIIQIGGLLKDHRGRRGEKGGRRWRGQLLKLHTPEFTENRYELSGVSWLQGWTESSSHRGDGLAWSLHDNAQGSP